MRRSPSVEDRPSGSGYGKGPRLLVFGVSAGIGLGLGLYVLDGTGLLPVDLPATLPASPRLGPEAASAPGASPSPRVETASATPSLASPSPAAAPASAAAAPASAAPSPASAAPPAGASSPSPVPAAAGSSPSEALAGPSPPTDSPATPGSSPSTCLGTFFPEGTFLATPPLSFVCEETDAVAVATRLKKEVVVAGRGRDATAGMKEWAVLGFYELAALAVMRGRCCAGAPPLTTPESAEPCGRMEERLGAIAAVSREARSAGDRAAAVKAFDTSVRCLMKFRQTQRFGFAPLLGSEASTFETIAARIELVGH